MKLFRLRMMANTRVISAENRAARSSVGLKRSLVIEFSLMAHAPHDDSPDGPVDEAHGLVDSGCHGRLAASGKSSPEVAYCLVQPRHFQQDEFARVFKFGHAQPR